MGSIYHELVKHFGSQQKTATELGVSQGTVSGWVRGIHLCSAEVALLAQSKTQGKFTAEALRPSLGKALCDREEIVSPIFGARQGADPAVNPSSAGGAS